MLFRSNEIDISRVPPLAIVDTKVCNASFFCFIATQETETVHPAVEGNVDYRVTELNGARNEGGGIEWRSISGSKTTSVNPDNDRKLSISSNSGRTERVQIKTWKDFLGISHGKTCDWTYNPPIT